MSTYSSVHSLCLLFSMQLLCPTSPFSKACGSYVVLPDDNSMLSANCDKFGKLAKGKTLVNKWGHGGYLGSCRPYYRMMH